MNCPVSANLIESVEAELLKLPQAECPVIHRFGPGVYIREVTIPAGTFAIGHYQNFEHINVMLQGCVTVLNEDGSTVELIAPLLFVGKPGRKVGYVKETVVWLNIYATEETDIEKLEAHFLTKSNAFQNNAALQNNLLTFKRTVDNEDYFAAIQELGFSDEEVKAQSYNNADRIELPYGAYKIKLGNSQIEGKGLFATSEIKAGEVIAPARIGGKRTIAGIYTNHSATPNAAMRIGLNCEIELVAIADIKGCFGGQDGEEITVDYRNSVAIAKQLSEVN